MTRWQFNLPIAAHDLQDKEMLEIENNNQVYVPNWFWKVKGTID